MIKKINIFLDSKIVDSGSSCAYHGKQQMSVKVLFLKN